jgi:amino acid permease
MWPACAKLDMSAMGWSSLLGVSATALTAGVMVARLLDGSYTDRSGQFVGAPAMEGISVAAQDPDPLGAVGAVLFLVSLLANSFIAHQCAPQLRQAVDADVAGALPEGSRAPEGVFDDVVNAGFSLSGFMYTIIAVCGYLTFGLNARDNVLDGYAASDPLAAAARLATVVWLACSFPQMLLGLRDSLRDLTSGHKELEVLTSTPLLLSVIALLAGSFTDLSTVMAIQGAVLGALLVFVLPGLMLAARQGGDTGGGKMIPHGLIATGTLIGAGGLCAVGLHAASAAVSQ